MFIHSYPTKVCEELRQGKFPVLEYVREQFDQVSGVIHREAE